MRERHEGNRVGGEKKKTLQMDNKTENKTSQNQVNPGWKLWDLSKKKCEWNFPIQNIL